MNAGATWTAIKHRLYLRYQHPVLGLKHGNIHTCIIEHFSMVQSGPERTISAGPMTA